MTPVFQTRSGPVGNCFEACLATLLDLTIIDVPGSLDSWNAIRRWLEDRGYEMRQIVGNGRPLTLQPRLVLGLAIVALRLTDGGIHSVVCRGKTIVHDPHPRQPAGQGDGVLLWTLLRKKPC